MWFFFFFFNPEQLRFIRSSWQVWLLPTGQREWWGSSSVDAAWKKVAKPALRIRWAWWSSPASISHTHVRRELCRTSSPLMPVCGVPCPSFWQHGLRIPPSQSQHHCHTHTDHTGAWGVRVTIRQHLCISETMGLDKTLPHNLCRCHLHATGGAMVVAFAVCVLFMPLLKPRRVLASVVLRGIRTALAIQKQDCKVDNMNKACHHLNDAPDTIQGFVTSSHPGPVKTDGEIDDTRFVDGLVRNWCRYRRRSFCDSMPTNHELDRRMTSTEMTTCWCTNRRLQAQAIDLPLPLAVVAA